MKRIFVSTVIFCNIINFSSNLSSKSLMPGLDRLKNKVENALNGPKTSIKDFLAKTKNITNQIFINGKSVDALNAQAERKAFEKEITEIEACFNNLYWCKQDKFAEELKNAKDIVETLKEKFKEKYTNTKAPLLKFAKDLTTEAEFLSMTKTKIEASINAVKKFDDLAKKYEGFAKTLVKYNETLTEIIKATEDL